MTRAPDAQSTDDYWIVILRGQKGEPLPMHDGENIGRFALFETKAEAFRAGRRNPLGEAYGFSVYRWGFV